MHHGGGESAVRFLGRQTRTNRPVPNDSREIKVTNKYPLHVKMSYPVWLWCLSYDYNHTRGTAGGLLVWDVIIVCPISYRPTPVSWAKLEHHQYTVNWELSMPSRHCFHITGSLVTFHSRLPRGYRGRRWMMADCQLWILLHLPRFELAGSLTSANKIMRNSCERQRLTHGYHFTTSSLLRQTAAIVLLSLEFPLTR